MKVNRKLKGVNYIKEIIILVGLLICISGCSDKVNEDDLIKPTEEILTYWEHYDVIDVVELSSGVVLVDENAEMFVNRIGEFVYNVKVLKGDKEVEVELIFQTERQDILVQPSVNSLDYNGEYYVKDVVELKEEATLVDEDEKFIVDKKDKYFHTVKVLVNNDVKEVRIRFKVIDNFSDYYTYDNKDSDRTFVLGEEVDVYKGIVVKENYYNTIYDYDIEIKDDDISFDKIGTYMIDYHITFNNGYEDSVTFPIYIVGDLQVETSNFPEDSVDEFIKKFIDNYLYFTPNPFTEKNNENVVSASMMMILLNEEYDVKDDYVYIPFSSIKDYSWKYFNYEVSGNYCGFMEYENDSDSCVNLYGFGTVSDMPYSKLSIYNRDIETEDNKVFVEYTLKRMIYDEYDDNTRYYAVYSIIKFELINEDGEYRIVDFTIDYDSFKY